MKSVNVTLAGKEPRQAEAGTTVKDFLEETKPKLLGKALAATINGRSADLTATIDEDADLEILDFSSDEGQHVFRHSAAHVMAEAVQDLFPGVKFAIGPALDNSFYYDFEPPRSFTPEDLPRIEERMR